MRDGGVERRKVNFGQLVLSTRGVSTAQLTLAKRRWMCSGYNHGTRAFGISVHGNKKKEYNVKSRPGKFTPGSRCSAQCLQTYKLVKY